MFPTFTGSSRPRRQVNLSGRNSNNPFAATQQTSNARSSPSAVALAQQERKARQQERERLQATKIIQKSWRGHSCRRYLRDKARQEWDEQERILGALPGKQSPEQLRLLLRFATPRQEGDLERVSRYAVTFDRFLRDPSSSLLDREWDLPLNKLCKLCLSMISHLLDDSHAEIKHVEDSDQAVDNMLMMVAHIGGIYPHEVSRYADTYYLTLRKLLLSPRSMPEPRLQRISQLLTQPLKQESYGSASLYRAFLVDFLTLPNIQDRINLTDVARDIKPRLLAKVLRIEVSSNTPAKLTRTLPNESLLWLLAYFIFLCRTSAAYSSTEPFLDIDYVASVSALLSDLADDLGQRPSLSDTTSDASLPKFIEQEVTGLINKSSITSLLVQSAILPASTDMQHQNSDSAAILASYALTLLQVFPRRGDEIRMWLYLGSTSSQPNSSGETEKTPAIRYFWDAVSKTTIFTSICTKPRNAVKLLGNGQGQSAHDPVRKVGQEWRVILLFLELYTFVLKFMDDEEFMNGANLIGSDKSWTRHSALELTQVRDLTMFLKNLAFAMYWHSAEITGAEEPASTGSLASYFGHGMPAHADDLDESDKHKDINIAGINGITLSYTKGMVTGLLRMIYERDSRRGFLPKGSWLMHHVDVEGFIPAVVKEQAFRLERQEEDPENVDDMIDAEPDQERVDERVLVGTHRALNVRRNETLRKTQQLAARRKQLEALTPRLEILQNMPFFIPFATRVEIFREFVTEDQVKRRGGVIDPDLWRMTQGFAPGGRMSHDNPLGKHHAKVRREHVFQDAYEQFYTLGDGLKEPIQITFVDQFDTPEAGIDGGGVTKEFLTSVTNEAFTPNTGLSLFVENDQHLLYPNPTSVDEREDLLRQLGFRVGSADWNEPIRDVLKQYEFLGRVVGKCLYEGILVDIHFAPFFLVKWALTGGPGSATNESNYRANINDLRDLDEGLYQGLLQLKNYSGNVEDFALDFTVTDTFTVDSDMGGAQPITKSITRELLPDGANVPVTNENRLVYITYMARHRLQRQPHLQTSAFLRGLGSMIQPSWLSMFNQAELQTLLGGDSSEIDVDDLRRNTLYGGVYVIGDDGEEHPTVKKFWDVMYKLSDEDRRKVLKYVTSTPRSPLLGFQQLNPNFSIRDSGSDQTRLPSTSTCVNLLKLPIYATKEVLREKLLYAINAGAGFNLS